ncbi:putative metal-dependent enzyme (double-stranded beta helix superfamily) [Shimia isoporae]|uniref:Putative metal-dependent enzyme (Double-stranded beta helix superfamily) n=1 Tax=Shimia isoporae TaxID=647720 RepID=A0A4R1N2K8_9RHOB|nr:cysteine dioxygenase family protein [Shimia isoporae]TCL00621.1 putative metal-dependent enzyme (double-stranded beta helix superfamily) [Shimia isoporae]
MQLESLITQLRAAAVGENPRADIKSLMQGALSDPEAFAAVLPEFEDDDVVLFEDDTISVWHCRFQPGKTVPPHDHKMLATIAVYRGAERNDFYERSVDGGLRKSSEVRLGAGDVFQIGPSAIHAVGCASEEPCCGIHVYLGELTKVDRSLFDLSSGNAMPFTDENYYKLVAED